MFDPLQNFLAKAAGNYGFTKQMKAIHICQEYRNIAPGLFPEAWVRETFPKAYDREILVIGVYNSMWAQTVMMKRQQILEAINKKFGEGTVKTVRIETCEKMEEDQDLPECDY